MSELSKEGMMETLQSLRGRQERALANGASLYDHDILSADAFMLELQDIGDRLGFDLREGGIKSVLEDADSRMRYAEHKRRAKRDKRELRSIYYVERPDPQFKPVGSGGLPPIT